MTLPCARCGRELESAVPKEVDQPYGNQPHGGTAFHTGGHYGSTVFDPMDGTSLELNICDKCLLVLARAGHVLHHTSAPLRPIATTTDWEPGSPIYFAGTDTTEPWDPRRGE